MAWRLTLNVPHLRLWAGLAVGWAGFVLFALIAGSHLKPRIDEVLTVALLPLGILVPYVIGCLIVAVGKALFYSAAALPWRQLGRNFRLGKNAASRANSGPPSAVAPVTADLVLRLHRP